MESGNLKMNDSEQNGNKNLEKTLLASQTKNRPLIFRNMSLTFQKMQVCQ